MEIGNIEKISQAIRLADLEGSECEYVRVKDLVMLLNAFEGQVNVLKDYSKDIEGFCKQINALELKCSTQNSKVIDLTMKLRHAQNELYSENARVETLCDTIKELNKFKVTEVQELGRFVDKEG